jgi:hypothetical protein
MRYGTGLWGALSAILLLAASILAQVPQEIEKPKDQSYLPVVIGEDFATIRDRDKAAKPQVM